MGQSTTTAGLKGWLPLFFSVFTILLFINMPLQTSDMGTPLGESLGGWAGPQTFCPVMGTNLVNVDGSRVFAPLPRLDNATDLYFGVTQPVDLNTTEGMGPVLTLRLHKSSQDGSGIYDAPLFQQIPSDYIPVVVNGTAAPMGRVKIYTQPHNPSGAIIVMQQGQFNASQNSTAPPVRFSSLALHAAKDGVCLWGITFVDPASPGASVASGCFSTTGQYYPGYEIQQMAFYLPPSVVISPADPQICENWFFVLNNNGTNML